jgi:hypothetical protein
VLPSNCGHAAGPASSAHPSFPPPPPTHLPTLPHPRRLFPPTQWSAEFNALIASLAFFWLVGESELREADVVVGPGQVRRQRSLVHIKKCRYLEASGCVGMCTK